LTKPMLTMRKVFSSSLTVSAAAGERTGCTASQTRP
jgi:hypothetical protein